MAKLVLHLPDGTTRDIRLDSDRITIGRRADNHIHLPYPAVSADHAEIVTVAADSFLHDLGSTNGTLVNGNRIAKHFLRNNDRIDIGLQQLVYLTNDAETVEPLPTEIATRDMTDESEVGEPSGSSLPSEMSVEQEGAAVVAQAAQVTAVDELLSDFRAMPADVTVAVAELSTASEPALVPPWSTPKDDAQLDRETRAYSAPVLVVLSGPNAGQVTTMTKSEFVMGKAGTGLAAIRRDGADYRVVLLDRNAQAFLNERPIDLVGALLTFGDMIDVGGVKLRFCDRQAT